MPGRQRIAQRMASLQERAMHVTKANTIIFRIRESDCAACPMKTKCCSSTSFRKIVRNGHDAARDVARRIAATP